jgi:imidazole glycerol-phosphate synthase subunit HisH
MIAVVDYGAGNLVSVKKALGWLQFPSVITADPVQVAQCEKIILPGVGHFATTDSLRTSGLKDVIRKAIQEDVPFLGICVGLQWMFEGSEEAPQTAGLGRLQGQCERFPSSVKSPHVGWNSIQLNPASRLFRNLPASAFMYFTHSFRAPVCNDTVACCDYGGQFSAAVERGNLFGVQFHPEKSGEAGLKLLQNFCAI